PLAAPGEAKDGPPVARADQALHPGQHPAPTTNTHHGTPPNSAEDRPPSRRRRKWLPVLGIIAGLVVAGYFLYPVVETMLNRVSSDDAYVNGHVTLVAPRVSGQVSKVLVDDNYRVKKGALLVQLDKEPYQVQVAIAKAALAVAETNLAAAEAQVRSL